MEQILVASLVNRIAQIFVPGIFVAGQIALCFIDWSTLTIALEWLMFAKGITNKRDTRYLRLTVLIQFSSTGFQSGESKLNLQTQLMRAQSYLLDPTKWQSRLAARTPVLN